MILRLICTLLIAAPIVLIFKPHFIICVLLGWVVDSILIELGVE